MDANDILPRLYLGIFEPSKESDTYTSHQTFALSQVRFLLSRVLAADNLFLKTLSQGEESCIQGEDLSGRPYIVLDYDSSPDVGLSFHIEEAKYLEYVSDFLNQIIDEEKVLEQINLFEKLPDEERSPALEKVRKRFKFQPLVSFGLGNMTPLDPFLMIIDQMGEGAKVYFDYLKSFEILALISSVILFKSISVDLKEKYDSNDAYLVATAAYSKLARTPNEIDVLEEADRTINKMKLSAINFQKASTPVLIHKGIENRKELISSAVRAKYDDKSLTIEAIANKITSESITYTLSSAIKGLSGFKKAYDHEKKKLGYGEGLNELTERVIARMMG